MAGMIVAENKAVFLLGEEHAVMMESTCFTKSPLNRLSASSNTNHSTLSHQTGDTILYLLSLTFSSESKDTSLKGVVTKMSAVVSNNEAAHYQILEHLHLERQALGVW